MKGSTALTLAELRRELAKAADRKRAGNLAWFFKTGKGQYGEGDVFCGITVPVMRKLAKHYTTLKLVDVKKLLSSRVHEHRFTALVILVSQYEQLNRSYSISTCSIRDIPTTGTSWIHLRLTLWANISSRVRAACCTASSSHRVFGSVALPWSRQ